MRHWVLPASSIAFACAANIVWIGYDTRPPFWDMATHSEIALAVYESFQENGIRAFAEVPALSGTYPPLFHMIVALFYAVLGPSADAARYANLPATAVLVLATYGIAVSVMKDRNAAALAGAMSAFFPFMLWLSRESVTDYWFTALVAASMWALIRSGGFRSLSSSMVFGVLCGFGMLTKWTFPIYVLLPALWTARRNWRNAMAAAAIAAVISAYWYVPQFEKLPEAWGLAAAGGVSEGDPPVLSLQAVLFYVRVLEGYQLFLPLFLVFVSGVTVVIRRGFDFKWIPVALWLAGGWLGLLLIGNKDPRYSSPLLPAVAIVAAVALESRKRMQTAVIALLAVQHVLVSFGMPLLPERVVLAEGPRAAVSYDWNFYTQTYFELWGKPAREDWQIERTLQTIRPASNATATLGIVPDLPRFDAAAFQFIARAGNYPVIVTRLSSLDEAAIEASDYVLVSVERQGSIASYAPFAEEINAFVQDRPEQFRVVDSFSIPSGETIRLFRNAKGP